MEQFKATTILAVKRGKDVAMAGDGQVTLGSSVVKNSAKKVRKIYLRRLYDSRKTEQGEVANIL